MNYFIAIISTFNVQKKTIKVTIKDFTWQGKVLNYVVANAKYFGIYRIAPHAEISDGEFAITNVGDISLLDYLKILERLKMQKSIIHKFLYFRSGSFH